MRLERAEAALGGELVKKKKEIRDFSKLGWAGWEEGRRGLVLPDPMVTPDSGPSPPKSRNHLQLAAIPRAWGVLGWQDPSQLY